MATGATTFLGSASERLLPLSLPFRFFGAAIVFHIATWAMLAAAAGEVAEYRGGGGPVLAAIHLLTLGVFAMTAMMLISLLARGVIGMHTLELALFIAPASVIGAIAGRTMFKIAPTAWFKHVAHWLLVAIGIAVVAN